MFTIRRGLSSHRRLDPTDDDPPSHPPMMTPPTVLGYVKAEPFRPFRIHMASGRTFDVRHPEMIKILKTYALIFSSVDDDGEIPDKAESLSLMLAESISHLEPSIA